MKHAGMSATDGFDQWAWLTTLCAISALTLLGNVVASLASRKPTPRETIERSTRLAAIALALFLLAAFTAWSYWMQVIAEQRTANYEIHVAYGLPTVTYADSIGASVSLLLIITWLAAIWRSRTTSAHRRSAVVPLDG